MVWRPLKIPDIKIAANIEKDSWITTVIKDSTNSLQASIDETAETHRMLTNMKRISALAKYAMKKKRYSPDDTAIVEFCLICERQVSMMTHLLLLRQQKVQHEEKRFGEVLEYTELWEKTRRGRATIYEQRMASMMSAEFDAGDRNATNVAREAEIEVAVAGLKALADEFKTAGMALGCS